MSEPVFVAFATQKGGAGKSTLTALTASYLHYLEGVDVMVMDCDDRQHSFKDYRDNDFLVTNENPYLNGKPRLGCPPEPRSVCPLKIFYF